MRIRELTKSEVDLIQDIVEIHLLAFRGFFLARLGRPFITQYYRTLLGFSDGIFLVAQSSNQVVGFATGFQEPQRFYRRLASRWWRFAWPLFYGLVRQPSLLSPIAVNLGQVFGQRHQNASQSQFPATVELSSIAVSPVHASRGVGRILLKEFASRAREFGAKRLTLTTDRDENERVIKFYRSANFTIAEEFTRRDGRAMIRFELSLEARQPDDAQPN